MSKKTFPKEGVRKLKQTIQDLKAYINELEARNDFLEIQLGRPDSSKEVEDMKSLKEQTPEESREAWRKDFMKRVRGK